MMGGFSSYSSKENQGKQTCRGMLSLQPWKEQPKRLLSQSFYRPAGINGRKVRTVVFLKKWSQTVCVVLREATDVSQDPSCFVQAVLALNLWGLPWRSTLLLRPLTKLVPQCEDRCSEPIQNKYFFLLYSQTANAWKNTALLCMLLAYSVGGPAGESVLSQYSTRHIKRCSFGQKQY